MIYKSGKAQLFEKIINEVPKIGEQNIGNASSQSDDMTDEMLLNEIHRKDYQEFVSLFDGLTFDEVTRKVEELGLYYGACSPENSRCTLDINYKSILGTVNFIGKVGEYDEN